MERWPARWSAAFWLAVLDGGPPRDSALLALHRLACLGQWPLPGLDELRDSGSIDIYDNILVARARAGAGDLASAVSALRNQTTSPAAAEMLIDLLQEAGRFDEALDEAARGFGRFGESILAHQRLNLLVLADQPDEARVVPRSAGRTDLPFLHRQSADDAICEASSRRACPVAQAPRPGQILRKSRLSGRGGTDHRDGLARDRLGDRRQPAQQQPCHHDGGTGAPAGGVPGRELAETLTRSCLDRPWDAAVMRDGGTATLFVSNTLVGLAQSPTGSAASGDVVRLTLRQTATSPPRVTAEQVVASGLPERGDPTAFVKDPTGLALAASGTLYVADNLANAITAVPHAHTRSSSAGPGTVLTGGGQLAHPPGLTFAGR